VYVDPAATRRDYQRRLEAHQSRIRSIGDALGIDVRVARTDQPLEVCLGEFLRSRARLSSHVLRR
jgi:hypothetical protein